MIRLKDFISMISFQNEDLNVLIYESNGEEIDYSDPDNFINRYISKVQFVQQKNIGKYPYTCNIILSSENGDETFERKLIKFSEISEICNDDKLIILPVDDARNISYWDESIPIMDYYESEVVINLIPFFKKEYTMIKVILSDNAQIRYTPKILMN